MEHLDIKKEIISIPPSVKDEFVHTSKLKVKEERFAVKDELVQIECLVQQISGIESKLHQQKKSENCLVEAEEGNGYHCYHKHKDTSTVQQGKGTCLVVKTETLEAAEFDAKIILEVKSEKEIISPPVEDEFVHTSKLKVKKESFAVKDELDSLEAAEFDAKMIMEVKSEHESGDIYVDKAMEGEDIFTNDEACDRISCFDQHNSKVNDETKAGDKMGINKKQWSTEEKQTERIFKCSTWGKSYKNKNDLTAHNKIHTEAIKPCYKCDACGKVLSSRCCLRAHSMGHAQVLPLKCAVCGKGYLCKTELEFHVMTHTGERPHKCPVCGKTFIRKSNLKNHSRIHLEDKPFKCSLCDKGFSFVTLLKEHNKTHSQENLFKCTICGKGFIRRYHLKTHLRTVHK